MKKYEQVVTGAHTYMYRVGVFSTSSPFDPSLQGTAVPPGEGWRVVGFVSERDYFWWTWEREVKE